MFSNDLNVIVYNFVDAFSHARTDVKIVRELADDEAAYRSVTASWFEHSPLWEALQKIAERQVQLIITTDHGTIRVRQPSKVVGDRETTTNLRYKVGKNLQYNRKDVLDVRKPSDALLPSPNVSSTFIFAKEDVFVEELKTYILKNIDRTLNGDIIGKQFGMSRMQLHRKLKALTNQSTSQFIKSINH